MSTWQRSPEQGTARGDLEGLARDVARRLRSELPGFLCYHDAAHTLEEVVPTTLLLADLEGIDGDERERLHAAALLHDLGYTRTVRDHEMVGAAMAAEILPRYGFGPADVAAIMRLILATRVGHVPETASEAIIADADLDVLGRNDFWRRHRALQRELAAIGQVHDDRAWTEQQQLFLRRHRYHTRAAQQRGDSGKAANQRRVATRLRRLARVAAVRAQRRP